MFECNDCSVMLLEGSMHVCRPKPAAYDLGGDDPRDFADRLVEELDNLIDGHAGLFRSCLDAEAAAKLIRECCVAYKPRRERKYVQFFERDDE